MSPDSTVMRSGFVVGADEGAAFWFLNTLTINKVEGAATKGRLCVVDHRVPPGFAPPPHVHDVSDEALFVIDGEIDGFCGETKWHAEPGSLIFLPSGLPHGFQFSQSGPGRLIIAVSPAGFDQFVVAAGTPATDLLLPEPVPPDPVLITQIAAAHGIRILPPPGA